MGYDDDRYINTDILEMKYYSKGYEDSHNFKLQMVGGAKDLLSLIHFVQLQPESVCYGSAMVVTDKQLILAYNSNNGSGSHNATLARIFADITDQAQLNYSGVTKYCKALEQRFLNGKIYVEKYEASSPVSKIISFSFDREKKKITPNEFEGFRMFYDEYAELLKKEGFDISLMGKQMSIDAVKTTLESMIDPELDISNLLPFEERIIGQEIDKKNNYVK